ncbi:hypothetical protein PTKIN_Ptkin09bG0215000 [Pterospermum kingtungense]
MGGTHGSRLVFLLAATLLVSVSEELNSEGQHLLEFTVLKMNSTFFQIGTPLMGHHGDGLFKGNIPKEIGNCSLLTFLYLNENRFSSPIQEEVGNLSSLEKFAAYTNGLTGTLPRSICNLQNLKIFHVGDFGLAKVIDMPQSKSVSAVAGSHGYIAPEYAYTMKVTEKCDTYSYGVVLLELLTGKTPVQPLDQGGDLVTRVRHYVREHSLTAGILDDRLNLDDESIVDHMITVLKIALICTSMSPFDRPSMREVVLMLIESKRKEDNFNKSPTCELPLRHNCDESM